MHLLLLNGPNLNLLGQREPGIYGSGTLASIEDRLRQEATAAGAELECFQSNFEGGLVERIHQAMGVSQGILINAGAYTHTSIALRDAVLAIDAPVWGVHLTDPATREPFRQIDYLVDVVLGQTVGMGPHGYVVALESLTQALRTGP